MGAKDRDCCHLGHTSGTSRKLSTLVGRCDGTHQYTLDKFFSVISYLYLHFILPKCDSGLSDISNSTQPDALTGGGVQIFDKYLTPNIS